MHFYNWFKLVEQGCYLALALPELPLGCLKHGLEQRVLGEMDTPLSILERAEREMLLVSCQHYELLHVHTLGVWASSRGGVRSMVREETESQTEGIK